MIVADQTPGIAWGKYRKRGNARRITWDSFAGAAIRSSAARIQIYERMSTNGGLQREHASGGDHITIPDGLEKNGQPQNDKKEI